ncbi:MAG TPA: hypothetical protein VG826_15345 [Pirellulales bacterium]|nr:hypothetical protein [Pirellulales bacterium]
MASIQNDVGSPELAIGKGILGGYVRACRLGQVGSREFAVWLSSNRLRLPDVFSLPTNG